MLDRTKTTYWHLSLAILLRKTTPRWFRLFLCNVLGTAGSRVLSRLRGTMSENLYVVTGDRRRAVELVRQTIINLCIFIADYMLFPFLKRDAINRLVADSRGAEHFHKARDHGRGIILITPHLGNWELAGIWVSHRDLPLNVVSLPDEDEKTEAFRNRMRRTHGIQPLRYDPHSSSLASMVEILNVLKRNELVAMLTDRPAAERTETVPFFDRPAPFPIGAFILSWISGAPVVPCYCVLNSDRKYSLVTDSPILLDRSLPREESVRQGVTEMAQRYESYVRAHPDQWYNFHPYWSHDV